MNIQKTCPNCGAPLIVHSFTQTCEFCGYITNEVQKEQSNQQTKYFREYYDYIEHQLDYIHQYGNILSCRKQGDRYVSLSSRCFSPNDSHFHLIDGIKMRFKMTFDIDNWHIYLLVKSSEIAQQPFISFQVESLLFGLKSVDYADGCYVFEVPIKLFFGFCVADYINIDTNLFDCENINMMELVDYSRRHYNLLCDRRKFSYTLNKKLFTDK